MLVRDYMTKNPVTIEPGDSLAHADIIMKAGGFRRLPVVKDGRLFGILSEYDLRRYLDSLCSVRVATAMTPVPITVAPSATLEHAASLLERYEIGALPVVDREGLIGIITAKDMWMPEPRPLEEWISLNSYSLAR
jgi:acetoin utilization protein AcuB